MSFRKFEDVKLICMNIWKFRQGAAVTLPGFGIITGNAASFDQGLLKHEFGHILQYRQCGFFFYWFRIAPVSFLSARRAGKEIHYNHMHCWTEWTANLISFHYFNSPEDWDHQHYPIKPSGSRISNPPHFMLKRTVVQLLN